MSFPYDQDNIKTNIGWTCPVCNCGNSPTTSTCTKCISDAVVQKPMWNPHGTNPIDKTDERYKMPDRKNYSLMKEITPTPTEFGYWENELWVECSEEQYKEYRRNYKIMHG